MGNLLEDGSEFLIDTLLDVGGKTITYTADSVSTETLAVVGKTPFQVLKSNGQVVIEESIDFIFKTTSLVRFPPARGDTIVFDGANYQVMAFGSEAPWRYLDGTKIGIRIHTKRVSQ